MDFLEYEQQLKSLAHHHRIAILFFLHTAPESSVEDIALGCRIPYKSTAAHLRVLFERGMIEKRAYGRRVEHKLTKIGEISLEFLRKLSS